jgi:hypothetical protein
MEIIEIKQNINPELVEYTFKVPYIHIDEFGNQVELFRKEIVTISMLNSTKEQYQALINEINSKLEIIQS